METVENILISDKLCSQFLPGTCLFKTEYACVVSEYNGPNEFFDFIASPDFLVFPY